MDKLGAASEALTLIAKCFIKAAFVVIIILAFVMIGVALASLAGGLL